MKKWKGCDRGGEREVSKDEEEEDEEEKSFSIVRTQKLATGKGNFFGFITLLKF